MAEKTFGELLSDEQLIAIALERTEVVPDDTPPARIEGFRIDISISETRALGDGPEAMYAYICMHFFIWKDQIYCRKCGVPILNGWQVQHYNALHAPRFGF